MNKSKFLKKSLAAVLAVLMVVAMIPLSAAAAPYVPKNVYITPGAGFAFTGEAALTGERTYKVEFTPTNSTPKIVVNTDQGGAAGVTDKITHIKKSGSETAPVGTEFTLEYKDDGTPYPFYFRVTSQNAALDDKDSELYTVEWSVKAPASEGKVKSAAMTDSASGMKDLALVDIDEDKKEITFTVPFGTAALAASDSTDFAYSLTFEGCTATSTNINRFGDSSTDPTSSEAKIKVSGKGVIGTNKFQAVPQVITAETQDGKKDVIYSVYVKEETGLSDIKIGDLETEIVKAQVPSAGNYDKGMETGDINVYVPSTLVPVSNKVELVPTFSIASPFTHVYVGKAPGAVTGDDPTTPGKTNWMEITSGTKADFKHAYDTTAGVLMKVISTKNGSNYVREYTLKFVRNTDTALTRVTASGTANGQAFLVEGEISGNSINITVPKDATMTLSYDFYGPVNADISDAKVPKVYFGTTDGTGVGFDATGKAAADSASGGNSLYQKPYTTPVSVKVIAEDEKTQRFYTLTVKKTDTDPVNPQITSAALTINKGKTEEATYSASVDQSAHTITFTVPHSTTDQQVRPTGANVGNGEVDAVYTFAKNDPTATITVDSAVTTVKDGGKVSIKSGTSDAIVYTIKFTRQNPETGKSISNFKLTNAGNVNEIGYNNWKTYDVSVTSGRWSVTVPDADGNYGTGTNGKLYADFQLSKGAHLYQYNLNDGKGVTEIKPADDKGYTTDSAHANTPYGIINVNTGSNYLNGTSKAGTNNVGYFIADEKLHVLIRDQDKSVKDKDGAADGVVNWKVINNTALAANKADFSLYVTEKAGTNARINTITDKKNNITAEIKGDGTTRDVTLHVPYSYVVNSTDVANITQTANIGKVFALNITMAEKNAEACIRSTSNGDVVLPSGGYVTWDPDAKKLNNNAFATNTPYAGSNCGFIVVKTGDAYSLNWVYDLTDSSALSAPLAAKQADVANKWTLMGKAEDGTSVITYFIKEIKVNDAEKGAQITNLTVNGASASINHTAKTITANVPFGTNLGQIKLALTASKLASVKWGTGFATAFEDGTFDLRNPLRIQVKSEDGAVTNVYTLTVKAGEQFTDVPANAWFAPYVKEAVDKGIVNGRGDSTFGPYDNITREDFAVMTGRMLGIKVDENATVPFTDASSVSGYAKGYVAYFAKEGIIGGYEDSTFRPKGYITREEAAKILAVALDLEVTGTPTFVDTNRISSWARSYVAAVQTAKIFNGDEANRFNGTTRITRAETAKVMVESLKIK